ncbi:hypothetical protein K402DRAFT_393136 [Aulographum hederae CBS 113979]|uniref:WD40 repeat-like protein n=1 Tax=Aulographum hederae CBS 113979 TaxID=1176131 RepID=A0A6G1H1U6_9PEZI|nr:hypothetical protein K402DRAFT_393136 [Aulographum hederae CBS 113979]
MARRLSRRVSTQEKKKYTIDAFDALKDVLSSSSGEEADVSRLTTIGTPRKRKRSEYEEDSDFGEKEAAALEAEEADEAHSFDEDFEDEGIPSQDGDDGGEGEEEDDSDYKNGPMPFRKTKDLMFRSARGVGVASEIYNSLPTFDPRVQEFSRLNMNRSLPARGVGDGFRNQAKHKRAEAVFGGTAEDLAPYVYARRKWLDQATLPTRKMTRSNLGGFAHSFYLTHEMRQAEAVEGWAWYRERGGKKHFEANQSQEHYTVRCDKPNWLPGETLSFVAGPNRKQSLFHLPSGASMALNEAFPPKKESVPNDKRRRGFLINVGCKPRSVDWAPNQKGNLQYLAVATCEADTKEHVHHPPYEVQPITRLQIWAVQKKKVGKHSGTVDTSVKPRLVAVLRGEWGDIRRMKWCPAPFKATADDKTNIRLGLLAIICSDGWLRVLDVILPKSAKKNTKLLVIKSAAFEFKPPNTRCTSIAWHSSTTISAGCLNGFVATWTLPLHIPTPSNPHPTPKAWFYKMLHTAPIYNIASAYPSRRFLLFTAGSDGFTNMLDLRDPLCDTATAPRNRIAKSSSLVWNDACQHVFGTDENHGLRGHGVRNFHLGSTMARTNAPVLGLASSPVHPFLLLACSDGSVEATNPFRRSISPKSEIWQQIWFQHEWRRPMEELEPLLDIKTGLAHMPQPRVYREKKATLNGERVLRNGNGAKKARIEGPASAGDASSALVVDGSVRTGGSGATPMDIEVPTPSTNETATHTTNSDPPTNPTDPSHPTSLPSPSPNPNLNPTISAPDHPPSQPLIRLTTSFAARQINMFSTKGGSRGLRNVIDGVLYTTLYEGSSAVTCVAWNPNVSCGGWAAAGCASGLVRVEDLCLD